ncbi:MAG: carbamate kinase [Actinomycetota bacterium]|nr:carbamate kinase [Actinomycetota bacterium]
MSNTGVLVVALGGNAIQDPEGEDSVEADFRKTTETAEHLARLVAGGRRIVVTHGNGPQVGNHLLRSELGNLHGDLPLLPLDVCVADTQGGMGYVIQQCLDNALHAAEIPAVVTCLITQVLVDAGDPAFQEPSKPIGEVISEERADFLRDQGWVLAPHRQGKGWRRVVASPEPREILEAAAIKAMVEDGVIVIAAGGGGVPVVLDEQGALRGIAAVVDKDLASSLLAVDLKADGLLILTNVERVALNYDTGEQSELSSLTVAEARAYLEEGQFPAGTMGPKIRALCRFVEQTGKPGWITSIAACEAALRGEAGTRIEP